MAIGRDLLLKPVAVVGVKKATFPEDYPAPFGGEDFFVRIFNSGDKARFESQFIDKKSGKPDRAKSLQLRERLAVATFCDESGTLLLTEQDVPGLVAQDGRVIGFIAEAAGQANKVEDADLESLAKN